MWGVSCEMKSMSGILSLLMEESYFFIYVNLKSCKLWQRPRNTILCTDEILTVRTRAQESISNLAGRYDNPIWRNGTDPPDHTGWDKAIPWNRFLGSLNVYKFILKGHHFQKSIIPVGFFITIESHWTNSQTGLRLISKLALPMEVDKRELPTEADKGALPMEAD